MAKFVKLLVAVRQVLSGVKPTAPRLFRVELIQNISLATLGLNRRVKDLEPLATCGAAADDNHHRMDRGQSGIAWRLYLILLLFPGYPM